MKLYFEMRKLTRTGIALLLAGPLLTTGCGSSSKGNSSSSGLISGNWQMSLQPTNTNLKPNGQSGFLQENGGAVTGSVLLDDQSCSGVGPVTGSVSGTDITLTANVVGVEVNLSGTLGSDQATMSGNYTLLPLGCTAQSVSPETGTWTANKVKPLGGNVGGSITSAKAIPPMPTNYTVSGQLSQGASNGNSGAPLTGTITIAGYCLPEPINITGVISGTSVTLNLLGSDGTALGEVTGTTSLDGTSLTGSYQVLPTGENKSGGTPPCKGGDKGTVTFTL